VDLVCGVVGDLFIFVAIFDLYPHLHTETVVQRACLERGSYSSGGRNAEVAGRRSQR
jgi:hypothetical protein